MTSSYASIFQLGEKKPDQKCKQMQIRKELFVGVQTDYLRDIVSSFMYALWVEHECRQPFWKEHTHGRPLFNDQRTLPAYLFIQPRRSAQACPKRSRRSAQTCFKRSRCSAWTCFQRSKALQPDISQEVQAEPKHVSRGLGTQPRHVSRGLGGAHTCFKLPMRPTQTYFKRSRRSAQTCFKKSRALHWNPFLPVKTFQLASNNGILERAYWNTKASACKQSLWQTFCLPWATTTRE